MTTQVTADLRAAAEVLRRHGWTQGTFYDPSTHRRCAVGAIRFATRRVRSRTDEALTAVENVIGGEGVIEYNDAPDRSADEVIAALETAADRAEAEQ